MRNIYDPKKNELNEFVNNFFIGSKTRYPFF